MNRSVFLHRAVGLAVAAGVIDSGPASAASRSPSALPWSTLARQLSGSLVLPDAKPFAALARPNNLRYAVRRPKAIAVCANALDVRAAMLWAREHGVPLVARSGGHSYAGYSTTTGLMIDVHRINGFSFNASTGVATFGGGARNRDIYARGRQLGVAVTHGRCADVGVAGLALGGGIGFNMRERGLLSDQLVESEVVTADGTLHKIDAFRNADLFWASRGGGGGNFGINTSFSLRTFRVGTMTAFDLTWDADLQGTFERMVSALESAPATLGSKFTILATPQAAGAAPKLELQLIGQLAGPPAQLSEILRPVYAFRKPSKVALMKQLPYWDAQDRLSELGTPSYFQERSYFFNERIGPSVVDAAFEWMRRWPGTIESATFKAFQTGGRMNEIAPEATAFVHRASLWLASIALTWNARTTGAALQRGLEWQSAFYDAIGSFAKGGAYQNFIDPSLTNWKSAYYGSNLARLEAIKRRVDPEHVFSFPEAIP